MDSMWHHAQGAEVSQVANAARRSVDIDSAELGPEFFPAHLSVALLDAMFSVQLNYDQRVVPIVKSYCNRFNLRRVRADRTCVPPIDEQETLTDLIDHYETLGSDGMQKEVVKSRYCSPGTKVLKSENVRRAAVALRQIGVETIQDAMSVGPEEIKCALRPLHGIGDRTIHMLLMYSGNDDFVKGDVHVCRFVAEALGVSQVPAEAAERLVRGAAYELDISPRLLDYEIWKLGSLSKNKR